MLPTGNRISSLKPNPYPSSNTRSNQALFTRLSTSSTPAKAIPFNSAENILLDFINSKLYALPESKTEYFLQQCKLACNLAIDFITSTQSDQQPPEASSYLRKIVNPNAKQLFQLLISPEMTSSYLESTIDFSRIFESVTYNLNLEKQHKLTEEEQEPKATSSLEEQKLASKSEMVSDQEMEDKFRLKLKREMEKKLEPTPDNALKEFIDFIKTFVTSQTLTITDWHKVEFARGCRLATFLAIVEVLDLGSVINVSELAEELGLSLNKEEITNPLAKKLFNGLVSGSIFTASSPEANVLSELKKIKSHSMFRKAFNLARPNSLSNLLFLRDQFIKLDDWYRGFISQQRKLLRIESKYNSYKKYK
jgi:hypothetical protein